MLLFFGFVAVCGTAFVQTGSVPPIAVWAAIPVGALATAVLVVNNVRDCDQDALVGKRTLAVRLGPTGARVEFALLVGIAELVPMALVGAEGLSLWVLLPLLTVPWAALLVRRLWREQGRSLNGLLARTAQLLLVHGCLLAVGLTLSRSLR